MGHIRDGKWIEAHWKTLVICTDVGKCHVWTSPRCRGNLTVSEAFGCNHVSPARPTWLLALM